MEINIKVPKGIIKLARSTDNYNRQNINKAQNIYTEEIITRYLYNYNFNENKLLPRGSNSSHIEPTTFGTTVKSTFEQKLI